MKLLAVIFACFIFTSTSGRLPDAMQTKAPLSTAPHPHSEMVDLVHQFREASEAYRDSLKKLMASYQKSVVRAEASLAQTRELFDQGLVHKSDVGASELLASEAKRKVQEVETLIAIANQEIAAIPSDDEVLRQEKRLAKEYKRQRVVNPGCAEWSLTASRKETSRQTTTVIRLTCKH